MLIDVKASGFKMHTFSESYGWIGPVMQLYWEQQVSRIGTGGYEYVKLRLTCMHVVEDACI